MQQSLFPQILVLPTQNFPKIFFSHFFSYTLFFLFIRLPLFSLHSRRFSLSPHHISSLPQLLPLAATPTTIALAIDLLWLDLEKSMFTFIYIYITNKPSLSPSLGSTILLAKLKHNNVFMKKLATL